MTTATIRGPYRRGIERRREVVDIATEVFGEFGFKGGTLQQVADRVGGTPAAVLKLFGTKEKLLLAVLDHWDVITREIAVQGTEELARLDGLVKLMSYHVEHKGLLQLYTTMAAEASNPQHPAHEYMTARYHRTLEDMKRQFRDAAGAGHFRAMSEVEIAHEGEFLLAAMDGLQIQFILIPGFDLVASFNAYVDGVLDRLSSTSRER
ncbi:TetR/AcrR family transcriptional regulator [Herbiconiux sp. L3-i23]|uniref:TetR/AcrR family transcriptional regulator n=1 Tax=Herbiconiux sp. L3-i23 TaxID=2905871 RepID=UPI00205B94CB|nr:TetR family transcriptional regulator [Herbiconiux sp. L3-i23]BDI22985.1 TetR family transcriptional regulator [Herbiconiux sp. L3-i23]